MKNITLFTSFAVTLMLLFASCSVEKRHYSKGYNVNWHAKSPKADETTAQKPVENHQAAEMTKPAGNQTAPVSKETQAKDKPAETKSTATGNKPDDTQSASSSDDNTPAQSVKPYVYNQKEATQVAKDKAKPLFDISHLKRVAEGSDLVAILAFVFGIIALFSYYASFLFALLAIIMGAIAMGRTSGTMHLLALLGLIFGIIAIFLWVGLFVFVI